MVRESHRWDTSSQAVENFCGFLQNVADCSRNSYRAVFETERLRGAGCLSLPATPHRVASLGETLDFLYSQGQVTFELALLKQS